VNVPPRTTVVLRAVIKNAIEKEEKNDRHK
jgi:hypothetical protein